ncbi:hypothetical protein SUGI_0226900 [Cryptomeria japonica]|uniref:uncharacterized protein LOC131051860 isoform X2 n=1 Tax=Cryptomeria japonica TaxID=3369 RepID=UPI002408D892|nr:uncharacterized protein LOC131051860 isoform X2 [Cryptomeria japonica]GLJ14137.1 hypothetical protein SUGI_0226900 [Cryptomeria japonica]
MEVEAFQECWKEESLTFVKEEFYESIQAPRWIDFTLPVPQEPLIDDNAWFCVRAGCDQKHGTLLDHSYSLKSQASKSVGFISKSPTMEGKSSVKPRLRAQLSTPTSKGKDRTPGKAKPPLMSSSKLRQKQCEENEDPNSANIGTFNFKMDVSGAEGFSSPKPSSNADGLDNLEKNPPDILTGKQAVAASDINLTPQNQSIKVTTAFSTPRIKKNHSVKREPFRSNPALSKGMNTAARSKAVAPRRILFETPTKSVKKTPSKALTPVTKHFSNPKKHVQFAAIDNKYSSPAKVTPRVCFTPCSLQPSESSLSRVHNFPSSSRPKDSRKVTNHPPSHRKVLVSEQSNEKESLIRANIQEMDLVQGNVGSTCKDGVWSENLSSIKQSHTGNDDEQNPPTYPGETSKEKNSKETMKRESGMEEQYAARHASIISGKRLTYGISEIESHKESESYGAEASTSNQDKANGVEQIFKGLRKDRENEKQNHSDGKIEIAILEVGENDDQNKFDVKADDSNLERRDNEAEMSSTADNRAAREMTLIKNRFPSELECNLQNDSDGKTEMEILRDRKNDDEIIQHVKPIDGSLQETENNDGSASESVLSGRNMRVTETTVLKSEFDVKHNEQNLEGKDNKFVMYSAAENKGSDAENTIIISMGSESESKLEVDSDGRAETTILEDGKHDGQDALVVRHNDNNLKEGETKIVMNSGPENEKVGEVLTISDCVNTRAVLETGIEVEPSKVVSQDRNVGKQDDFYPKNKQNSKENEDHVIFDQHVIRGAKEGNAGEVIQLESDLEFQSKILQKDISSDSGERLEVTVNVAVKYVKEDNRDSMQKINAYSLATENGELKQCNELKDHTIEVGSSDSRTSLSEVNRQSHLAENEMIKSDVWGHAHCLETFEEHHHGGLNRLQLKGIDGGLDCDEYSIIPQSKSDSSLLFVSESLSSEVVCQLPRDCDEIPPLVELKKNEEIRLPDRDCLPHSKSDGAVEVLAVAGCNVKKEILSTPSKGEKRTSGEMNSKINCSNGEVCQDESCCMAFSTCQSALPTKVNGTSIPRAFNHKKIKPTLPRPFRLRTAERGERKEMGLNKKTQLAEENETSPMREIRANKAQGTHSHIDPSKRGKSETPKPHEGKPKSRPRHIEDVMPKMLEDKGEEIKSTPEEPLNHRPVKMPNFSKPPFKPMRSTKKLTTPKEPNFHPMHSKK